MDDNQPTLLPANERTRDLEERLNNIIDSIDDTKKICVTKNIILGCAPHSRDVIRNVPNEVINMFFDHITNMWLFALKTCQCDDTYELMEAVIEILPLQNLMAKLDTGNVRQCFNEIINNHNFGINSIMCSQLSIKHSTGNTRRIMLELVAPCLLGEISELISIPQETVVMNYTYILPYVWEKYVKANLMLAAIMPPMCAWSGIRPERLELGQPMIQIDMNNEELCCRKFNEWIGTSFTIMIYVCDSR